MKVNLNQNLKNIAGEVFKNKDIPITLGQVCLSVLLSTDTDLSYQDKFACYQIAELIYAKDEVDLDIAYLNLLKFMVAKVHLPSLIGPVFKALDGLEPPKEPEQLAAPVEAVTQAAAVEVLPAEAPQVA